MKSAMRYGVKIAVLSKTKESAKSCMDYFFNEPDNIIDYDGLLNYRYDNGDSVYWVNPSSSGCGERYDFLFYDNEEIEDNDLENYKMFENHNTFPYKTTNIQQQ